MVNISVIIPAYNAEKYIEETIHSVLKQTYPVDEIIIINDCSTDSTLEIVKKYEHNSIFNIQSLKVNKGLPYVRNFGLSIAKHEWVLLLDSDDIIHPTLVEKSVKYITDFKKSNKEPLILVHTAYQQIDANGNPIGGVFRGKPLDSVDAFGTLFVRNQIITPSGSIVNRDIVLENNGFNTQLNVYEDIELWLRLSLKGHFGYIDEPLTFYRRHGNNITSDTEKARKSEAILIRQYDLDFIKEAILKRKESRVKNILDYVSVLYRFDKFEEGYKELLNVNPENKSDRITSLFLKGLYYVHKKQYVNAKKFFEQILAINSNHGASLNNLGVIYALEGKFDQASDMFNKALLLYSGYMDATHNLNQLNNNFDENSFKFTWRELRPTLLRYQ